MTGSPQGARRQELLKLFLQISIILLQGWPDLMVEGLVHRPNIPWPSPEKRGNRTSRVLARQMSGSASKLERRKAVWNCGLHGARVLTIRFQSAVWPMATDKKDAITMPAKPIKYQRFGVLLIAH